MAIILRTTAPMPIIYDSVPDSTYRKMTIYPEGTVDIYLRSIVTMRMVKEMIELFESYDETATIHNTRR